MTNVKKKNTKTMSKKNLKTFKWNLTIFIRIENNKSINKFKNFVFSNFSN